MVTSKVEFEAWVNGDDFRLAFGHHLPQALPEPRMTACEIAWLYTTRETPNTRAKILLLGVVRSRSDRHRFE